MTRTPDWFDDSGPPDGETCPVCGEYCDWTDLPHACEGPREEEGEALASHVAPPVTTDHVLGPDY